MVTVGHARILPTRNGNTFVTMRVVCFCERTDPTYKEWKRLRPPHKHRHNLSTDPTYKEWKLVCFKKAQAWFHSARILPTRNGNVGWGVRLKRIYFGARILPTRNGNGPVYTSPSRGSGKHGSYLQGMETEYIEQGIIWGLVGTDPTYKEWKRRDGFLK